MLRSELKAFAVPLDPRQVLFSKGRWARERRERERESA